MKIITCLLLILTHAVFGQLESPDGRYVIEYFDADGDASVSFKNKATGKILLTASPAGYEGKYYESVTWSPDSRYLAVTSRGTKTTIDLDVFQFDGDKVAEVELPDYRLNIYGRHQSVDGGRCHFVKGVEWIEDGLAFSCMGNWIDAFRNEGDPAQWYSFRVTFRLTSNSNPERARLAKMEELPYDPHWFRSKEQVEAAAAVVKEADKSKPAGASPPDATTPESAMPDPIKTTPGRQAVDAEMAAIAAKCQVLMELNKKNQLLGKTLVEIETLIGPPTSHEGDAVIYFLDTGWGGLKWTFKEEAGVIKSVRTDGID